MRRRRILQVSAGVVGLLLVMIAAGIYIAQSHWFYERVRRLIVSTVETATGGRVEVQSFDFDWRHMRATISGFAIHGLEPPGKPPLFRASSISVGLKIVSVMKHSFDIQYFDVADPRVYLIVNSDGSTNVPEPKLQGNHNAVETVLDLAIGRFSLSNGLFEVESHGATPFDARGQGLNARFQYEPAGPSYRGDISIQPLELQTPRYGPLPLSVALALNVERNRIGITSAKLSTSRSNVEASGVIENLTSPRGSFQYDARVSVAEAARILRLPELQGGTIQAGGNAKWDGSSNVALTGNVHGYDLEYRDSLVRLRNYRLEGALTANPEIVSMSGIRLSGEVSGPGRCKGALWPCPAAHFRAEGRIATASLRGRNIEMRGVALAMLGGSFHGDARLRDLERYAVQGEISGFDARRVVAIYSAEALPWNAAASGNITIDGSLRQKLDLRVGAKLAITPALDSAPVYGQVEATYEARGQTLDLGHSIFSLPSSRAEFAGIIGRELRVQFETSDLNDVLPVLGESAATIPIKLDSVARFDGTVLGKLPDPKIVGHLSVARFSYSGKTFDGLDTNVEASPDEVVARNAAVTRGAMRVQFHGTAALHDWKADDSSAISGQAAVSNANLGEVASLLEIKDVPISGTASGNADFSGSLGNPIAKGTVALDSGSVLDEPFDHFRGTVSYSGNRIDLTGGRVAAGSKQVELTATFDHAAGRLDSGTLHFQVATNSMPLDQIRTLQKEKPGIKGTIQVSASGELAIVAPAGGQPGRPAIRIASLHADAAGKSLQFTGQALGDAHLTADSQGQTLHAHLESSIAESAIRADGTWRLEGDYPGTAVIALPKVDLAQLRPWLSRSSSETTVTDKLAASAADAEVKIEGPLWKPANLTAELRIPKLSIGSKPGTLPVAETVTLTNSGPIVATLANSVITIQSARLVGRATDFNLSGKVSLSQKNPLDLRLGGHIDLAIVHSFNSDLTSSGSLVIDGAVRGAIDDPQMDGRVQVQDAALSLADFPIGITKANGRLLLSRDRATIQDLSGEAGGGKIQLTGFAGYTGGEPVFRIHVRADQVRVRYPEGVSTVANANLNLTGTAARSMLEGTVTVVRTGFNLESDFSSLIAKSAEPIQTPAAQTGFLGGLNFDIQVNTAPDIQLQSALTEDLQAEANLRLRGTATNPGVTGRINITQGQVVFYGTKFNISQGTVSFFNPLKVEPILDVDLETKARGVDIILTVAGPLNKLKLTPRSDPPLQFNEIVALLATGQAPTSDPTLLAQQSTAPQSWQQMGATALLGQAITSPVAGRLQRFFGVSRLRIDPSLPGVENNPQARVTLEQQITPDITFTYITNITTSNPQVVRMEWAFAKRWSVVALRDENGTLGLDFFFKRRF